MIFDARFFVLCVQIKSWTKITKFVIFVVVFMFDGVLNYLREKRIPLNKCSKNLTVATSKNFRHRNKRQKYYVLPFTIAPLSTKNKTAIYTYSNILVKQYSGQVKFYVQKFQIFDCNQNLCIFYFWCFLHKQRKLDKSFDGSRNLDYRFSS
jgi:hypothetical protein